MKAKPTLTDYITGTLHDLEDNYLPNWILNSGAWWTISSVIEEYATFHADVIEDKEVTAKFWLYFWLEQRRYVWLVAPNWRARLGIKKPLTVHHDIASHGSPVR